jgi:uncharacterized membrane-anchored protein YhcB (DUF1043 family)
MKNSSKEILTAAIGIAAGTALGVLLAKARHKQEEKKSGEFPLRNKYNERLIFVKNKLEKHRERLDRHLQRINSKIEAYNLKDNTSTI